ncbi:ATP-grasp domain-containing protein [Sinorhizobium garamanticum]|uniref:ATP-grasp domain-containing protein n=1 Tax=Sinorhizobium garamanticum TaxID=680247 RepID=A0ABY8DFW4_9HYPH|nr:ATP-grasp domain-containing protein [Sinorhizobium garamanticum]WEX89796.1 ATP-grasp domain-containing protein [Sinorhizobium garamanticum]
MRGTSLAILVSSAGRRVGLIECFRRAALDTNLDLKVLACDADPDLSAACQIADKAFKVPRIDHPDFAPTLRDIAARHEVRLVVPTIDPELLPLAIAAGEFEAIGARVHVSPPSVINIARDKAETMRVLAAAGVPVPATTTFEDVRERPGEWPWPLFMKPRNGSASRLIRLVRTPDELPRDVEEPMIVQEFLDGPEYTINAFIDATGRLKTAVAHHRLSVRAGEVEKGRTVRDPRFTEIAHQLARSLPEARGVLCFQIIVDRQRGPKVIEINARFGGGYPLVDRAGATFARWLLEEVAGLPSSAHDEWREGVLMLRYDAAVYGE